MCPWCSLCWPMLQMGTCLVETPPPPVTWFVEAPALTSPFSDEDTGPSVLIHRLQDVRALSWVRGLKLTSLLGEEGGKLERREVVQKI